MLSASGERELSKVAAVSPYDQVNMEIPVGFPEEGVARARRRRSSTARPGPTPIRS